MRELVGKQNQSQKDNPTRRARLGKVRPAPIVETPAIAIQRLQRTIGNQGVARLLQSKKQDPDHGLLHTAPIPFDRKFSRIPAGGGASVGIQPKLSVNAPGDIYEREADRVADQVMRKPEPQLQSPSADQHHKHHNAEHTDEHLQAKAVQATDSRESDLPSVVHEALNSSGQRLGLPTREFMEPRFGQDFGQVRIHADSSADQSNRALGARAFTYGRDIFFRQGEYDSSSHTGKGLLAHELHHTLQQQGNPASPQIQRQSEGGDDPLRFLKGTKTMTAQADKTSTTGSTPNIIKEPFGKQKTSPIEEELTLLDNILSFLGKLDKKVNSMKGDATLRVGGQIYGTQSSSKDSPGAKPAKNFIDIGSVDFKELNDYFDLLLTTMGDRMPTSTRQAMKSVREKFDKLKELKDPQKVAEIIYETAEDVQEIKETLEEEERNRERDRERDRQQAKAPASASKEQSDTKTGKATKIDDGRGKGTFLQPPLEFTVPSQDGSQEATGRWADIYVKAADGSGLFKSTLNLATSTYKISTFGDELYTPGGLPADQIFSHFPKGYKYIYVGEPKLKHLLPSH